MKFSDLLRLIFFIALMVLAPAGVVALHLAAVGATFVMP